MKQIKEPYHLFSDPIAYYNAMIDDIDAATKMILLETYRLANDEVGIRFKKALIHAAKKGVKIKMLLDYWGSATIDNSFVEELKKAGIDVRFFEKIKFNTDVFTRSHRRNHRKLLLIDDTISYIGSANITGYNLSWRESVVRIIGDINHVFRKVFNQDFSIHNKYILDKSKYLRLLKFEDFEIIRDMPSITKKRIMKKYVTLINHAKETIAIATPYFLPGYKLRKALVGAVKRGVKVYVVLPRHSDVGIVDILRNKYLGPMHELGIQFLMYMPHNLHAKLVLIDNETFTVGSPNFDYRSFRYMYEIVLLGKEPQLAEQIKDFFLETIEDSEFFNYEKWKARPLINRFFEWLLVPFRHLL
jgi:cardiolipin synthase